MTEMVRGNKASELRSRIFRVRPKSSGNSVHTTPLSASTASQPKKQDRKTESETTQGVLVPRPTGPKANAAMPFQSRQHLVQIIEMQKKLEDRQKDFMQKLRLMDEQGMKLPGDYKFVVKVFKDERAVALDKGDSPELPKDIREFLALKPTSCETEKRFTAELALRDQTIVELKEKLQLSEKLSLKKALRLDELTAAKKENEETLENLKSHLLSARNNCNQMCSRLKETEIKLEQATDVNISDLQEKLKEATLKVSSHLQAKMQMRKELDSMKEKLDAARQLLATRAHGILELQVSERHFKEKFQEIFQKVGEGNTQINQLANELAAKNEQLSNVRQTLKETQETVARQKNIIRLMEEQESRNALMRTKQAERSASMLLKISQLKQYLRNQAQAMFVN